MSKYLKHLALCFAAAFLITAIPVQVWAAGGGVPRSSAEGSSQTEAGVASPAESSTGAETAAETEPAADASDESPGETAPFAYEHDPMENPKAAQDIMVNPDAVYGYSPRPDSVRLKEYADADWSNAEVVEEAKQQRIAYHESIDELYRLIEQMLGEGKNVEEIARAVSTRRNEIRLESYKDDPEGLEKVKKSNLDTYGNENGPTPDQLYEKYGSWQTVLEKALSSNPGMDACLGLYDIYYDTYDLEDRSLQADAETSAEDAQDQKEDADTSSKTYIVVPGDSLWNIAEKHYGEGTKWNVIYDANKDKISNPGLIFPGQELEIPNAA